MKHALMPPLLRSLVWSGLDTLGALAVGLGSVVIIARMIGPAEFGLGALALGLVMLVMLPAGSLVHDAIVQRAEITPDELDAARQLSLLAATGLALLVAVAAAPLALVLAEPRLAPVIWALLPTLIFNALAAPLTAERRRAMDFGTVTRQQLATRTLGLAAAIATAAGGGGVWAVVAQQLVATGLLAGGLTMMSRRRLRWWSSPRPALPLLAFSHYIVWTQLLLQATDRLFLFAVGYVGGMAAAGHWGVAARIVESLTGIVNATSYNVALAHLSRLQQDRTRLACALADGQGLLMLGLAPVIAALAAAAGPLVELAMGAAWRPVGVLVSWMLLGALITTHLLIPAVALNALGCPRANLAATGATGLASLLCILGLGAWGPVAIAAVRGLSPLAGWSLVALRIRHELPLAGHRLRRGLLLDLLAVAAAVAFARELPVLVALEADAARLIVQAGLASLLALMAMALTRQDAVNLIFRQLGRRVVPS